jgi:plasmid stability protein
LLCRDAGVKERLRVRAARHGRSGALRYGYIDKMALS